MKRRFRFLLAGFAALVLALTPMTADARAGSGSSWGSRGSRTWSAPPPTNVAPYSAQPMQRSLTPNTPGPGVGAPPIGAPMQARSPFMSGLMGGLIGAGIGGLLFGHGLFGGISGIGGFFGFLLQIFLIVLVVRWLIRRFRGPRPMFAGGGPAFLNRGVPPGSAPGTGMPGGTMGGGASPSRPVAVQPSDYQAFEQILKNVQAAWSAGDLNALRNLATPEMVSYFAEQLADYTSRSVRNVVSDVRLLQGDLSEAWEENGREFATVAMRFSMIDVTLDAQGRVVDGSSTEPVTATELWTFMRTQGGRWLLSAIQQAR